GHAQPAPAGATDCGGDQVALARPGGRGHHHNLGNLGNLVATDPKRHADESGVVSRAELLLGKNTSSTLAAEPWRLAVVTRGKTLRVSERTHVRLTALRDQLHEGYHAGKAKLPDRQSEHV